MNPEKRRFLLGAAGGAGLVLTGCATHAAGGPQVPGSGGAPAAEDIAPPEDLMREHGVLNRILLIYDESARRLSATQPLPVESLAASADLLRRFIEEYHEKLEEDFLFPRFEKARQLVELVATLRRQHLAGRVLTETIRRLATAASVAKEDDRKRLGAALGAFTRMYRPHEAREDTVLFPALRGVFPPQEMSELGERFEDEEHRRFGKEGFEGVVVQVEALERAFGLFDLDQFTPSSAG